MHGTTEREVEEGEGDEEPCHVMCPNCQDTYDLNRMDRHICNSPMAFLAKYV
jgi:hypothetical protein